MKKKFKLTNDEKEFLKRIYLTVGLLFIITILISFGSWIFDGISPFDDISIGFLLYVWSIVFCFPIVFIIIRRTKWFK